MQEASIPGFDGDPLEKLVVHLYELAESQRETNTLLLHLMQKPTVSQKFLSALPNITYLKGTGSVLISSQSKQTKKLWCIFCKKKTLVHLDPLHQTAKSQCGHLQYCSECSIETHRKIMRCPHCLPFLHPKENHVNNILLEGTEQCPVCSNNLAIDFINSKGREETVFKGLMKDYFVVVDVYDPHQCGHLHADPGIKRERNWDAPEPQPKRFAIAEKINETILPKVRDGVLGMSKMAMEVGSNFLSRLSELDGEDEDSFYDGLV